MSTTTTAYGVKIELVASAIGSRDQELLAELRTKVRSDPFAKAGEPTSKEALEALISGEELSGRAKNALQLYALELLCEHYGRRLDGSDHISYLDDLGWQTKLLDSGPPLGLPRSDDFPDVAYLSLADVRSEYERFSELETECDDVDTEEAREELLGWLQQCDQEDLDLVTFQY